MNQFNLLKASIKQIRNFVINTFLGGVIIILPALVLYSIATWLLEYINSTARPLTNIFIGRLPVNETLASVLTLLVVFILFSIIGMLVRTRMGSIFYNLFEGATLARIPGYKTIKDLIAQVTGDKTGLFKYVALVKLGGNDYSATGFIVDEYGDQFVTAFIPCGPNPTTGFIYHIPKKNIERLNVSVETAMRTVIACGSGSAKFITLNHLNKHQDQG